MPVVAGLVVPSSPVLVPEVGRGRERQAVRTVAACRAAGRMLREAPSETLVLLLPAGGDRPTLWYPVDTGFHRDFAALDAPELDRMDPFDPHLAGCLVDTDPTVWQVISQPSPPEDALAALYFLSGNGATPILLAGVPDSGLDRAAVAGRLIGAAAQRCGRRMALVAVGELSSRIYPGAPDGYHPDAASFDANVIDLLHDGAATALGRLPAGARATAGERLLPQLCALLAAAPLSAPARLLSYEHPYGTGYLVASFSMGPPPASSS
jgi:hypothetical protein